MLQSVEFQQSESARLAAVAALAARRMRIDPGSITASWLAQIGPVLAVTTAAQRSAASLADEYVADALDEQDIASPRQARVDPNALAGIAGDGRSLDSLYDQPRIQALARIGEGVAPEAALAGAVGRLQLMATTAVQDANRAAQSVAIAARPKTGWVRVPKGATCSRCMILLGRFYRYSDGFDRHYGDDCEMQITTSEAYSDVTFDAPGDFTDLTEAEQDKVFGKANAQAVRDGADVRQVVNAGRGMQVAQGGAAKGLKITTEGTTRRGAAAEFLRAGDSKNTDRRAVGERYFRVQRARLMPSTIYRQAESRDDALRLLRANGFILR